MNIKIELDNKSYLVNTGKGIDLSIPTDFKTNVGPRFYEKRNPELNYYTESNKEYNLENGGGCNVPIIKLNIHCSGTHTECANHIIKDSPLINELLIPDYIPSQLITVNPEHSSTENYHSDTDKEDRFITKIQLEKIIDLNSLSFNKCLIIRTNPNSLEKCNQDYNKTPHPFLTNEAIVFIKDAGFKHIVVDMPSIDRYNDGGELGNHHIFFTDGSIANKNTITELVYIPDTAADGKYFLNLNISNFKLDAAPSRPFIYSYKKL